MIDYIDLKSIIHNDLHLRHWPEFDIKFLATQYKGKGTRILFPKLEIAIKNAKTNPLAYIN